MATLLSAADGNFTAAGTWRVAEPTSVQNANDYIGSSSNQALTTSYVASADFSPATVTIDAIAIQHVYRTAAAGTLSIKIFNVTTGLDVAGSETTFNVSDIPALNTRVSLMFAAPITLNTGETYNVQIKCSTAGDAINLKTNGVAGNWSKALRTTTTQAPAAADLTYYIPQLSGSTWSGFTVTMDNTAATNFGYCEIGNACVLEFNNVGGVALQLRLAGLMVIYNVGELRIGTSVSRFNSTSTATLQFICASNVQYGLNTEGGAIINCYGADKVVSARLNANSAAAATSHTTDVSTGWANGELVVFGSTTAAVSGTQRLTVSSSSGTNLVTTTGVTAAKSGTGANKSYLINLTRNVKIKGTSATLQSYLFTGTVTAHFDCVEFSWLGSNVSGKRGIQTSMTSGVFSMNKCSMYDFVVASSSGWTTENSGTTGTSLTNNVSHNIAGWHIDLRLALSNTTNTFTGNIGMTSVTAGTQIYRVLDGNSTFNNNVAISGAAGGMSLTIASAIVGSFNGNVATANGGSGIILNSFNSAILDSNSSYLNTTYGFAIAGLSNVEISNALAFGNTTANLIVATTACFGVILRAPTFYTSALGISIAAQVINFEVTDGLLGVAGAHTTADYTVTTGVYIDAIFRNTTFGSTTEVANQSNWKRGSELRSARHDQTSGNHRVYTTYGTQRSDTTIFRVASPSIRVTPLLSTLKFASKVHRVAVRSGGTARVRAWVRKSVVGDGTAYNGNQVRLMVFADSAAGVTSDTILATSTVASDGDWELLEGVTPVAIDDCAMTIGFDCDGTTGWVNVDDFQVA